MSELVRAVIIDDNASSLEMLSAALERTGVSIATASDPEAGLALIERLRPRLVITDLVMPRLSGLDVLRRIMAIDSSIDVILMTAHYTTETAVEAIQSGAADYLQKPVKIKLLRERVGALLKAAEGRRVAAASAAKDEGSLAFEGMISRNPAMWEVFGMVEKIAPHSKSTLIYGETGTGKDLIARAIHKRSGVSGKFVALNCSSLVETLFESELFGHVRGSFTGADRDKVGLIESANGGTLFLDEIGDMPLATQAKLLRTVQNQEVLPLGSVIARKVNVRIVAATHRKLRELVDSRAFREDLFYRLSMVTINLPSLRSRKEDIALLAAAFAKQFSNEFSKPLKQFTPRARIVLERYDWPGNVRELEHVVGRACMLADGPSMDVDSLPEQLTTTRNEPSAGALHLQERAAIEVAMRSAGGNVSEAARRLGIGRDALRYKLKQHGLSSASA